MKLSLIVAMARNRVIGREGKLPWRLSHDLRQFKQMTMGHPILMGRKTFESIGRVLPGRTSIVLTRQTGFHPPNVLVASSLAEAVDLAAPSDEAFVIGGAEIYAAALPIADRIYVTAVQSDVEGDTFFPPWDESQWRLVSEVWHPADEKNSFDCNFEVYDRTK